MGTFIDSTHIKTLVPFKVISSGCNALVVSLQQFLKGPIEVLLCECVNDLRYSLFHLLNCLMTASELRDITKSHREQGLDFGRLRKEKTHSKGVYVKQVRRQNVSASFFSNSLVNRALPMVSVCVDRKKTHSACGHCLQVMLSDVE